MKSVVPAALIVAVALAASPALTSNFGSNTASGGTSAHPCDDTSSSQCVAPGSCQTVLDYNLASAWHAGSDYAINSVYKPRLSCRDGLDDSSVQRIGSGLSGELRSQRAVGVDNLLIFSHLCRD